MSKRDGAELFNLEQRNLGATANLRFCPFFLTNDEMIKMRRNKKKKKKKKNLREGKKKKKKKKARIQKKILSKEIAARAALRS